MFRYLTVLIMVFSIAAPAQIFRPERVQRAGRSGGRGSEGALPSFVAFLGYTQPCNTGSITANTGQPLVFARSSGAVCTKSGLGTTGIQNGDVVKLTNNQARIMPSGDGNYGPLIERAGANTYTYTEDFSNANWIKYQDSLAGLPTITADSTVAPDGTSTADTISLPSTTPVQSSVVYQTACAIGQQCAISFYVKGVSGSGTIDVCAGILGSNCQACSYNSSTWSRCTRTGIANNVGNAFIGNASLYNGGTARPAQDIYVWGAQAESGATYVSSYIPATGGSGTSRSGEVAQFDLGANFPAAGNAFSLAVTNYGFADTLTATAASGYWSLSPVSFNDSSSRGSWAYQNVSGQVCIAYDDAVNAFVSGFAMASPSSGAKRWSCWSSGAIQGNYAGATLSSTAQTGTFSALRYFNLGTTAGLTTYIRPGIYTNVCLDGNSSRCR